MNSTKPTPMELRAALLELAQAAEQAVGPTATPRLDRALETANAILRGDPRPQVYELNDREHATALAALRKWQRSDYIDRWAEKNIASNDGKLKPLDEKEIDSLCERLNSGMPTSQGSAAARLASTIEATGGVIAYHDGTFAPVGDCEWIDLGDAYIAACAELGREPKIGEDHRI